jgi:hypothetical protein
MATEKRPATRDGVDRAGNALSTENCLPNIAPALILQAHRLARRFGFAPETARAVAGLVFGAVRT